MYLIYGVYDIALQTAINSSGQTRNIVPLGYLELINKCGEGEEWCTVYYLTQAYLVCGAPSFNLHWRKSFRRTIQANLLGNEKNELLADGLG